MIDPVQLTFLILFGVLSIVQLVFCFMEKDLPRMITKPFCMVALGIFVTLMVPNTPLIYTGIYLAAVGDIFLLWPKKRINFILGTLSFIAGHICYFVFICKSLSYSIHPAVYISLAVVLTILIFALYPLTIRVTRGIIALLGNLYFPLLLIMLAFGILLTVDNPNHWIGLLVVFGYVLFILSDLILSYTTYVKHVQRKDFYIMLTYLVAEFLIATGLTMAVID